jgi:hypothetical protein
MASKKLSPGQRTDLDRILKRLAEMDGMQESLTALASRDVEPRLLQTSLFQDCEENQIWGETQSWKQKLICQNRSMLVKKLAYALKQYTLVCSFSEKMPQKIPQETPAALKHIDLVLSVYMRRRLQQTPLALSQAGTKKHRRTIKEAWDIVQQAVCSVTSDDYARTSKIIRRQARVHLLNTMYDVFVQHGPFPQDYSQTGRFYSIATILRHFGLEKGGTIETVVARLIKLAGRATGVPAKG